MSIPFQNLQYTKFIDSPHDNYSQTHLDRAIDNDHIDKLNNSEDVKYCGILATNIKTDLDKDLENDVELSDLKIGKSDFLAQQKKWLKIVSNDCTQLKNVPEEILSDDICFAAVKQNLEVIAGVPNDLITKKFMFKLLEYICSTDNMLSNISSIICNISDRKMELCEVVSMLRFVPEKYKTYNTCLYILHNNPVLGELLYLPENEIGKELLSYGCRQFLSYSDKKPLTSLYQKITKYNDLNMDIWMSILTIKLNDSILESIKSFQNISKYAFKIDTISESFNNSNNYILKYIPDVNKTIDQCYKSVEINPITIQYVPSILMCKKICDMATDLDPKTIQYVPQHLVTESMCEKVLARDSSLLNLIPSKVLTVNCLKLMLYKKYISLNKKVIGLLLPGGKRSYDGISKCNYESDNQGIINFIVENDLDLTGFDINDLYGFCISGRSFNKLIGNNILVGIFPENKKIGDNAIETGLNIKSDPFRVYGSNDKRGYYCMFKEGIKYNNLYNNLTAGIKCLTLDGKLISCYSVIQIPNDAQVYIEKEQFKVDKMHVFRFLPILKK
jgi:hypothetical protein